MKQPLIYEVNARTWTSELSSRHGGRVTLANIPEQELDRLASLGLDFIWLMGVWSSGPEGIAIARRYPALQEEYRRALPDLSPEDVCGSPYAIAAYDISDRLGGEEALASLRRRLADRGIGLVLDFVINHTGRDHSWLRDHPEFYIQGGREELSRSPDAFFGLETSQGFKVIANGRDPNFPSWTDTAQLNLLHPGARAALLDTLLQVADRCDGVRCDMAMLGLLEVIQRTWGDRARSLAGTPADSEIWSELVSRARARNRDFLFIAEAYWGLEEALRSQGFDYCYDRALYERLVWGTAPEVREHLQAEVSYQRGTVRFLENHDELRAAAVLSWDRHRAAAVVVSTVPGMALLQHGQLEGREVKAPIQLCRSPEETVKPAVWQYYQQLLGILREDPVLRRGEWHLLPIAPAWEGNPTGQNFVAYEWTGRPLEIRVVVVNLGNTRGQCYLRLGRGEFAGREIEFTDLLAEVRYLRGGDEIASQGLYLDMPEMSCHVFAVKIR
jgi:hypothetical protein